MRQGLPETVAFRLATFVGREWTLPPILDWFDNSQTRFFVVTAPPGTGKSMLAAWLAGDGDSSVVPPHGNVQLARLRQRVAAIHFCQADTGSTSPRAFANNMANQLTRTVPGFDEALTKGMSDLVRITGVAQADVVLGANTGVYIERLDLGSLAEEPAFDNAFRNPLVQLCSSGKFDKPILLIVDALDEARTYSGKSLLDLLNKLNEPSLRRVRILVTTRPDRRVLLYFDGAQRIDLIDDAPPTNPNAPDDVFHYVAKRLIDAGMSDHADRLAPAISKAARGNFLYAHLVLADLLERGPDADIQSLPPTLDGWYRKFLMREIHPDDDEWDGGYKPILGLLAVAQQPGLTRQQLKKMSGIDAERPLRACTQFLTGRRPEGPFRAFHRSFVDFLFDDDDYRIDAEAMHRHIADFYWAGRAAKWQSCDAYGFVNLAEHLTAVGLDDRLNLLLDDQDWYAAKVRAGFLKSYQADVERVWAAAGAAALDLKTRCALQLSSVQSAVAASLLRLCLDNRVVSSGEALALALQHESPFDRVSALTAIIPALEAAEQEKVIEAELERISGMTEQFQQSRAWVRLAPVLGAAQAGRILAAAEAFDEPDRDAVVAAIIPRIGDGDVSKVHDIAISTSDASAAIRMLTALTNRPNAPDREALLDEAYALVSSMGAGSETVVSLCKLAAADQTRRPQLLDAAFTQLRVLDYSTGLAPAVASFVETAGSDERLRLAFEHAERTYHDEDHPGTHQSYLSILAAVGGLLSDEQRAQLVAPEFARLAASKGSMGQYVYREYGAALLAGLPAAQQKAAFAALMTPLFRSITSSDSPFASRSDPWIRPAALRALDAMPIDLIDAATDAAHKITRHSDRADALTKLLPRVEPHRRAEMLGAELARVRRINDGAARARARAALVPYTPIGDRPQLASAALDALAATTRFAEQIEWLTALMPHLPSGRAASEIADSLNRIGKMPSDRDRAAALATIAASLPDDLIDQAVRMAEAIGDDRHVALAAFAARMHDEAAQRRAVDRVFEAFEGWRLAELPDEFVQVVRAMAPCLTDADHRRALVLLQRLHTYAAARTQASIIELLAPRLMGEARQIASNLTESLEDETARTRATAALGPVPEHKEPLQRQVDAALATREDDDRALSLSNLLAQVPASQSAELYDRMLRSCLGLKVARTIGSTAERQRIPRDFMLERVGNAGQALARIGGEQLVAAIVHTIDEVTGRWP